MILLVFMLIGSGPSWGTTYLPTSAVVNDCFADNQGVKEGCRYYVYGVVDGVLTSEFQNVCSSDALKIGDVVNPTLEHLRTKMATTPESGNIPAALLIKWHLLDVYKCR